MTTRFAAVISELRDAAQALDSHCLFHEAEALDTVLMRLANQTDMQDAGGLYGAVGNMNNLQNTGLGKGIATSVPNQGYYGKGVNAPLTGPKILPGMSAEQMGNAKMQWAHENAAWFQAQGQLGNQQLGDYFKNMGFSAQGQQIANQGNPGANGQFEVPNGMPMPSTYTVPPLQ